MKFKIKCFNDKSEAILEADSSLTIVMRLRENGADIKGKAIRVNNRLDSPIHFLERIDNEMIFFSIEPVRG